MFRPVLIIPPAENPVSLDEVKRHCVVDFDDDDAQLEALRDAAVSYLDGFRGILGRGIITQTWELELSGAPRCIQLPVPDVSAARIVYAGGDGSETTSPDLILTPTHAGTQVALPDDFQPSQMASPKLRFTCGFGGPDQVPPARNLAIKALAAHWYEGKSARDEGLPMAVSALIQPYRWIPS
jgi:uncharacterized phiE125 gp8 family phage protein